MGRKPSCCYAAIVSAQCCASVVVRDDIVQSSCCTQTRRTCCNDNNNSNQNRRLPPCCYSANRPSCCTSLLYSSRSYSRCCGSDAEYAYDDDEEEEDMASCCTATGLSFTQCCRDTMIRYGKSPSCCAQLEGNNKGNVNSDDRDSDRYDPYSADQNRNIHVPPSNERDDYPGHDDRARQEDIVGQGPGANVDVAGPDIVERPHVVSSPPLYETFPPIYDIASTTLPPYYEIYSGNQSPTDPAKSIESESGDIDNELPYARPTIRYGVAPSFIPSYETGQLSTGERGVYEHDKDAGVVEPNPEPIGTPVEIEDDLYDMFDETHHIGMNLDDLFIEFENPMMEKDWNDDSLSYISSEDAELAFKPDPEEEIGDKRMPLVPPGNILQNQTKPENNYDNSKDYSNQYKPPSHAHDSEELGDITKTPDVTVTQLSSTQTRYVDTPKNDTIIYDPVLQLVYHTYYVKTDSGGWQETTDVRQARPEEIKILPLLPGFVPLESSQESIEPDFGEEDDLDYYGGDYDEDSYEFYVTNSQFEYGGDYYDAYEENMCGGEPYHMTIYICCDGITRYRIGVQPKCCGTQAFDAIMYECCEGDEIRRSCDLDYKPQKTSWGGLI